MHCILIFIFISHILTLDALHPHPHLHFASFRSLQRDGHLLSSLAGLHVSGPPIAQLRSHEVLQVSNLLLVSEKEPVCGDCCVR